jgi:hypothetical protein
MTCVGPWMDPRLAIGLSLGPLEAMTSTLKYEGILLQIALAANSESSLQSGTYDHTIPNFSHLKICLVAQLYGRLARLAAAARQR